MVEIEYIEKQAAPWPERMMLQNDWVSSIAVSDGWYVCVLKQFGECYMFRQYFNLLQHAMYHNLTWKIISLWIVTVHVIFFRTPLDQHLWTSIFIYSFSLVFCQEAMII